MGTGYGDAITRVSLDFFQHAKARDNGLVAKSSSLRYLPVRTVLSPLFPRPSLVSVWHRSLFYKQPQFGTIRSGQVII